MKVASTSGTTQRDGALLGAVLPAAIGAFLFALSPQPLGFATILGVPGMVVGAIVGYRQAPAAVAAGSGAFTALKAGVQATLLGTGFFVVALPLFQLVSPGPTTWPEVLGFELIVVIYGVVTSLPFTIPIAFVAVWILRAGRARPRAPITVIAAAALLAAALVVVGPAALRPLRDGETILSGPVDLEWTVVNRSRWRGDLAVNDPDPANRSVGGSDRGFEPCAVTTDRTRASSDWFISIAVGPEVEDVSWMFPEPTPLVGAATLPGDHAVVWIDIGPDRTVTVGPPRTPTAAELASDPC